MLKSELEKLKQEKENNQLKIEEFDNASKSLDKLVGSQIPDKNRKGVGFVSYNPVPPPPTGLFSPLKFDLSNSGLEEFQRPEFEVRESPDAPLVEVLVSDDKLEKKNVFPTVAKIEFANCNYHQRERVVSGNNYTRVNYKYSAKKGHPSAHRNMVPRVVLMKTGLRSLNTARPVNTAHPKTIVNVVKASACWVWRPTKLNSASITLKRHNYVDARGRSKYMIGKYVPISQIFIDLMDDMIHLGKELKGGRICQVLLKVPRKNNMYSVDMKNIVPKESLTCLVAKATLDESMLWHRRLGHVNFKTINKLVKDNLVKGLPIKRFENDQTCVACLKGKQHKASSSKDETSGILKSFIAQIENLVDKKVKIIRSDNRTEFKNRVMTDSKLPTTFWAEAVNIACYVQNRDASNDEPQPSNDVEKKGDEGGIDDQERTKNSAQDVNIAGPSINTASTNFNTSTVNINTVSPTVPTALLKSTYADFFGDESELDLSNIGT
ncbi:ribonuclease H-like domain-containing protein, partial [Tanacetum coccineum]